MPWRRTALLLGLLLAPIPGEEVAVTPAWQRCDVAAGESTVVALQVVADRAGSVLAVETDCGCVALATPLPLALPAGEPVALSLRVVGVRAGVKSVTVRTTLGTAIAAVHVVTPGIGQGADLLRAVLVAALAERQRVLCIVHDLRGALRNCGCSAGALGGIDHLAALPATCRALQPEVACECLLTGDADGTRAGVEAALAGFGWHRDPRVIAGDDADAVRPELLAVVASGPIAVNHRRLIRPLLDRGLVVELVVLAADGSVVATHHLPVDATLPGEPAILEPFPQTLSIEVRPAPATACAACHAAAHATWTGTAHARAWAALAEADRVDACIGCHTTRADGGDDVDRERPTGPRVTDVQCQACHRGADEHARQPAMHTLGVVDCRSCHDAQRHPAFRAALWEAVRHGR